MAKNEDAKKAETKSEAVQSVRVVGWEEYQKENAGKEAKVVKPAVAKFKGKKLEDQFEGKPVAEPEK